VNRAQNIDCQEIIVDRLMAKLKEELRMQIKLNGENARTNSLGLEPHPHLNYKMNKSSSMI
jgi:hypothetical protein